ncbi:cysteine-rich repeat secretory protein 4-like [Chenopodium quinoa]|uniref:Gnk2-homologous domain-containing protein n=1 Tax=Chenopodium quinoa TaxID=63459 RepID=A0A803N947_CHEQI|nr:cysteine-rich repeat secretory protein 4-like [Chenopodium quinoa]
MRRQNILIFVFNIVILTLIKITIAQTQELQLDFAGGKCLESDIINTNGTYHSNILTLLSNLQASSSIDNFSNSSVGLGPDRVNGYYLCRPDISLATCETCINATINTIDLYCFDRKEAIIWYDECMIRYTNNSISALESNQTNDPWYFNYGTLNVSEPKGFPAKVNTTLRGLILEAISSDNPQRFYAHGKEKFTLFEGFYGMVLCRPDMTAEACESCLVTALGRIPSCCVDSLSVWTIVMLPNCQVRYDTAPFIFDSQSSLSLSPPLPLPPTLAP